MPGAPLSTYRVQLTPEHGFAGLAAAAAYLARLGVGSAYLSPVLQAVPGSQHGYDVLDHRSINAELGGEAGLRDAVKALRDEGLGVVVDVVPNHMALPQPEHLNRVLWSVLRDGPQSPYARWFDLEATAAQPILLPILGERIDEALDAGHVAVDPTGGPEGEPVLRSYDHLLPLRPGTEELPIEELLAAQYYRVAYWRVAHEELNYRRFFDIDTLVAIRVEEPEVFQATHEVLARLVREGVVDGIRVDHPDGLADPRGYLVRLAEATGGAWVVAEKILGRDEQLPEDWACAGTTGYEAAQRIGGLFVDPGGAPVLTASFAEFTGREVGWPDVAEQARRDVLENVLVAELDRLVTVAHEICQQHVRLRDHSRRGLADGLHELLAAMDVYRAYVVPGEPAPPQSVAVLERAAARARERRPDRSAEVALLLDLALGRLGRGEHRDDFCVRFQQTSGPVAAKGVEDTACYRWYPLASLCEVGGEPDAFGITPAQFGDWAAERQRRWPTAMTTLSTHDTKRSEDVRARLAVLSEIPGEWALTVRAWRDTVAEHAARAGFDDPLTDWLFWQTLVGAWPIDADRLVAYLVKATREAKLRTSWSEPETAYEDGLETYVRAVLDDEHVMAGVIQFIDRLHNGFVANCLGQRAVQLLTPGVPDVYGGCELVSLRLVDPDNRVPVDADDLDARLTAALAQAPDPYADLDAAKLRLTSLGLRLRRDHPVAVGPDGEVAVLEATGAAADHVVGLVRGGELAVVTARFVLRLAAGGGWRDTTVALPEGRWHDVLTDTPIEAGPDGLPVEGLLGAWPVALLVRARP